MQTKTQKLMYCGTIVSVFLLLSACSARQSSPTATLTPVPAASVQPEAKPSTPVAIASTTSDPFPKAEDKAISAANLARNASTVEDWDLVSSKLRQAIALMKAVPAKSPKHALAKKKLAAYQQQLKMAQQRSRTIATAPIVEASVPQKTKATQTVATTIAPALSGVGSLTSENYTRIEFGMSPEDVRSLLGPPTREEGKSPTFSWIWESTDKKTTVNIGFYNNKVSGKMCVTSSPTMKCVSKTKV